MSITANGPGAIRDRETILELTKILADHGWVPRALDPPARSMQMGSCAEGRYISIAKFLTWHGILILQHGCPRRLPSVAETGTLIAQRLAFEAGSVRSRCVRSADKQ
jgi:hypothetical protein